MNAQQPGEASLVLRATLNPSTQEQQPGAASYALHLLSLEIEEGEAGQDYSSLSVPVSVRPFSPDVASALSFHHECSANLVRNLERQICAGRNHALRSCLRVRAAGFISGNSPLRQLEGTLRFEAIFPNESFQFLRIRQPPLLSTPLSMKLTSLVASPPSSSSALARPRMGYLTLNKTRKVVPLLETDPAASLAPLVGIWVSVDAFPGRPNEPWLNPFVHGACVRFLKDGKVRERVLVDEDTFLLANFSATGVEYFEVTRLPRAQGGQGGLDFAVADFLLDLSLDARILGRPQTVVGRFKQCRHCSESTDTTDSNSLPASPRVMSRPYGEAHALRLGPGPEAEASGGSEMLTPIPRDCAPIPSQVPLTDPVLSASEPYLQGPGALRSSLSLSQSDGTQSNRSSLESFRNAQLMRLPTSDGVMKDVAGGEVRSGSSPRLWPTHLHVETETGGEEDYGDEEGERSDEYEEEELDVAANMLAVYLGVDVDVEPSLVEMARQALLNLPPGWELGISDEEGCYGIPFYLHTATETSVWLHPQEELLRRRIEEARAGQQLRQQRLRRRRRRRRTPEDEDEEEEDGDEEEEDGDEEEEDGDEEEEDGNEEDALEFEDPLLSAAPMVLVLDDTNLRLSTDLRRLHFPTNPLASLAPSVPVLRPGGDEDSLLMEAGLWGSSRLSSVASSMESDAFFEETAVR